MKKFWNWLEQNESETRELRIDGQIAEESWFDDDITPELFRTELNSSQGDISVYINSPGGDCVAASQIYTMLSEYPGKVTVKIDGLAASAASVIAMAGNEVQMSSTAMMMIHNPLTMAFGNADEMQKAIEMLDEVKESIINAYEKKTGLSRNKISRLMDEETWMNARKAIELGFADSIIGNSSVEDMTSVSFGAKTATYSIIEKMVAKYSEKAPKNEKTGRNIEDLLNELYKKQK